MKSLPQLSRRLLVAAFLGVAFTSLQAADSVTFTETYADKVVSSREDGETFYDVIPTGSFTAKATLAFDDGDIDIVPTVNTPVVITVGNWAYEGTLGDDERYTDGKSSATILLTHEECKNADCDDTKEVTHGKITIKASSRGVAVTVTAKTGSTPKDDELEESPAAANFAGETLTIVAADGATLPVSIDIGNGAFHREGFLALTGKVATKTVRKGSGEDAEEFETTTASLKGKLIPQE